MQTEQQVNGSPDKTAMIKPSLLLNIFAWLELVLGLAGIVLFGSGLAKIVLGIISEAGHSTEGAVMLFLLAQQYLFLTAPFILMVVSGKYILKHEKWAVYSGFISLIAGLLFAHDWAIKSFQLLFAK